MPGIINQQLFRKLLQHYRQRRDYRHLLSLDEHLLKDIGLSREEVRRAAGQPFWKRCEQPKTHSSNLSSAPSTRPAQLSGDIS